MLNMKYENSLDIIINENVYSNPDNLNFYLAKSDLNNPNFEIIKKQNFMSNFGEIEIAIIGSSHYFLLKDSFIEIMTCSEEKYTNEQLIFNEDKHSDFVFEHKFDSFLYRFSAKTKQFNDLSSFLNFERTLLTKKTGFYHAFSEKSAITSIDYTNTNNEFLLSTHHTYPEYNKIISSETQLLAVNY